MALDWPISINPLLNSRVSMTLGNKIKALRADADLSQPQLAEKIGIEQSYLSKLENDKSLPSNEVFRALLQAFDLNIANFANDPALEADKERLKQIPDIETWYKQQDNQLLRQQRRYLYICSSLIVIAVTLFYVGKSKSLFSETYYKYVSKGVILPSESKHIFENWDELLDRTSKGFPARRAAKSIEMTQRFDEKTIVTHTNQGDHFELDVYGGRRFYQYYKEVNVPRSVNAWLQVLGVFLFSMGLMGFVLERKLLKY